MKQAAGLTLWSGASTDETVSRQQRRRDRKLNDMMSFTAQTIAERGYHMTNLDDIAERLDLSKASIYHYFDGKEALVLATLASCASYVQQRLAEAVAEPGTASERLQRLIRTQIELISVEDVEVARLFLQPLDWPPAIAEKVREWQREHGSLFRDVIREGVESGEFDVPDERVARMVLQGGMNFVPAWFDAATIEERGEQLLETITDALMRVLRPSSGA